MNALFEGAAGVAEDPSAYYHTNLFRYQGVSGDQALECTLWSIAAVLALVIVVASISLIYNAFAISVAERTRQFGLLASLGASKKQLRCSVLSEAFLLGIVGIPLGLVLGVAGTAGVFAVSQDAFSALMSTEYGLSVRIEARPLISSALLTLVTLLVSAWLPAVRAARVSAVDAIRQSQGTHLSRRAERKERASSTNSSRTNPVPLGVAGKLFGISGFIAHRNLARSTARGRTVVASLAVCVILVVSTGSAALYLTHISNRAQSDPGAGSKVDIRVSAYAAAQDHESFGDLSQQAQELNRFVEEACSIEGVELIGSNRQGQTGGG